MLETSSLRLLTIAASFTVFLLIPTSSSESSRPRFDSFKHIDDILRLPQVYLPTNTTGVSKTCEVAINIVLNSTALWNLYLDAIGKPQSGIFLGNVGWLGSYSECTKIIQPAAHYCLAYVLLNQTITIDWGICVPQKCSEDDVVTVLGKMITALNSSLVKLTTPTLLFGNQGSKPKPVYCAKPSEYTTGVIVTLALCGLILFLVLIGTVVDVSVSFLNPRPENVNKTKSFMPVKDRSTPANSERFPYFADDGKSYIENERTNLIHSYPESSHSSDQPAVSNAPSVVVRFFLCFSVIQNTNRIMDTDVPPGAITSINGMRVLSMWWVILGHTYAFQLIANVSNIGLLKQILQRFTFQTVDNATFSVDSFFFLSGLLVSYLSLRQMEKKDGKFPIFKFYFHRFWRLTPAYMFVLLFYDKLTGFLGEGPIWFEMQTNPPCDKYWWTNLLYINNFYPTSDQASCMGWAWYLANDMQFYVISPIIIYAAYRFQARGLLATVGILLCANFITTALIINHYDLDSVLFARPPGNQKANFMSLVYVKPYCRIAPYLVGMLLGYVFHVKRRKIRKVYVFNVIGWCVAVFLALSTLYGEYKVFRKENPEPFNKAENITYGTFSRFAWSLALAWVIYACHHGLGGLVDNILSARFWIPLSRLTYGAYLVHIIAIGVFFGSFETVWAFSDVHSSYCFAAVVTISYAAAFILAVCVEFPMMQLEKLIFKTNR